MRKYSSSIKTAFLSDAGSNLSNNDYFAFVELEDYACYVIADGISTQRESESAKLAIHTVIREFQESPAISRRALKRYLGAANRELVGGKGYEKHKASITVVVSNYEAVRYAYAGNTRLRLYRDGKRILTTADMSLSNDMAEQGKIPLDALARHEERNNLYSYLGKEHFSPFISAKIKLQDMDIITLSTRGIWENVKEGDQDIIIRDAGNEPESCCGQVEELIVAEHPEKVENYTFAAIFIEKVFTDPERQKRTRKIITASVTVAIVALIVGVILYILYRDRERAREEMALCYQDMLEYIADSNFVRAEEECGTAAELAKKLYDKEMRERLSDYQKFLEAVAKADSLFEEGKYMEASEAYLSAKIRSRQADNVAQGYMDKKMGQTARYRAVYDNIALGDRLLEEEEYSLAEEKYLTAKKDAAAVYFEDGKQQAVDALDKLYEEWTAALDAEAAAQEKEESAREEQAAAIASEQVTAAEMVAEGDGAYQEGDLDGAMVFYLIALEKYSKLEDTAQITKLNRKIIELNDKQEAVEAREAEAKSFQEQAQIYTEEGQYAQAKEQYQYAQGIYKELGQDNRADEIQGKMDIVDTKVRKQETGAAREAGKSVSGNEG